MPNPTYASTLFAACPDCHQGFGQTYDKDSAASTAAARESLRQQVEDCNHVGTVDL